MPVLFESRESEDPSRSIEGQPDEPLDYVYATLNTPGKISLWTTSPELVMDVAALNRLIDALQKCRDQISNGYGYPVIEADGTMWDYASNGWVKRKT